MNVYIFGAGASRGSQQGIVHDPAISPVTNDLFDPRYKEFAIQVGLNGEFMNTCRNKIAEIGSFEKYLTAEWDKISKLKDPRTRNAQRGFLAQVAFYVWLVLRNVSKWSYENQFGSRDNSTYLALMNRLLHKDEEFGLINFNYDLLLDYAYKDSFKVTFNNLDNYLDANYVKPHGSINWLLGKRSNDITIDTSRESSLDTRSRLDTAISQMYEDDPIPLSNILIKEPNHRDLYTTDSLIESFNSQYFYPLIFLPLTSKSYSSIEGFEDKITKKGKELMGQADEIFMIGYRADDEIIKDLVSVVPQKAKLHVVGNESAELVSSAVLRWAKNLEKGAVLTQGFHRFVFDNPDNILKLNEK